MVCGTLVALVMGVLGMEEMQNKQKQFLKTPFFYGWVMVFVAGAISFFSGPGQTFSVSMFINSYIEEFGWSRSLVSSMYSLGTLAAGLTMWKVGSWLDQKGHRFMTIALVLLFGLAAVYMSVVSSPIMLVFGFFLIRLVGSGSMSLSSSTIAPQWFVRKRATAVSLVSLGGVLSAALIPVFNASLINQLGWRTSWRIWAIILWGIMLPIAYFLIIDKPERIGKKPDGDLDPGDHSQQVLAIAIDEEEPSFTLKQAMKTTTFWLVMFVMMIPSAIGTGLTFHQVSIMGGVGLGIEQAALALSIMAVIRFPVVLICGQMVDRLKFKLHHYLVMAMGILLLAIIVLFNTSTYPAALTYSILRGSMMGLNAVIGGVIWPTYFGREHLGSIRGTVMMISVMASAFGPMPFGLCYDLFGGYREVMIGSMVIVGLGMVAAALAKQPSRPVSS